MARIELCNITKRFKKITAINDIKLEVKDKEFLVLFGPAGAGKTTILKTIAGLEYPDQGQIKFDGEVINHIEPTHRNVSMVFENYALYPHINVYDNIASPLRSPLYKKDEEYIKKKVNAIATVMKIENLMERLPSQLSNGQRQRVALGRCLVREPKVFLMDEPLAHLDAKLRHLMRAELKEMQSQFNTTTIYVTHDYMEALSLGDRIAIVIQGKFEQIGTGDDIFYRPANELVAKLMGEPEINIFQTELVSDNGNFMLKMLCQERLFALPDDVAKILSAKKINKFDLGIRGNDIKFYFEKPGGGFLTGTIYTIEPIGNKSILTVDVNGQFLRMVAPSDLRAEMDSTIYIKLNLEHALFFNCDDQKFVTRHVSNII
jgi:multiple sugar transport system ATP-binding protein